MMRRKIFVFLSLFVFLSVLMAQTTLAQINNDYQEKNPLVLYDDNTDFWSVGVYGSGSVSGSVEASTSTTAAGSSSLQINVNTGQYLYIEVGRDFHANQDWSSYDTLGFWFYGTNSLTTIQIGLAAPDSANQYMLLIDDDFAGWTHLIFPFESFLTVGSPTFSKITQIGFFFFNSPNTFYIDRLIIDSSSSPVSTPSSTSTSATPNPTSTIQVTPSSTLPPTSPAPTAGSTTTPVTTPATTPASTISPPYSPANTQASPVVSNPPISSQPTSTNATNAAVESIDWFRANWQWIILFLAIIIIVIAQIAWRVLRRRPNTLAQ